MNNSHNLTFTNSSYMQYSACFLKQSYMARAITDISLMWPGLGGVKLHWQAHSWQMMELGSILWLVNSTFSWTVTILLCYKSSFFPADICKRDLFVLLGIFCIIARSRALPCPSWVYFLRLLNFWQFCLHIEQVI